MCKIFISPRNPQEEGESCTKTREVGRQTSNLERGWEHWEDGVCLSGSWLHPLFRTTKGEEKKARLKESVSSRYSESEIFSPPPPLTRTSSLSEQEKPIFLTHSSHFG